MGGKKKNGRFIRSGGGGGIAKGIGLKEE